MGKKLKLDYKPRDEGVMALRERLMYDAAKRYRWFLRKRLREDPWRKDVNNESRIHTLELFFRSQWGQLLSGGIGEVIIEKTQKMVLEEYKEGRKKK